MKSLFHLFSLGIVLETKKAKDWIIKVYPIEHIPLRDAELNVEGKKTIDIETLNGETISVEVKEENAIYAVWLSPGDSHQITPPDVVAGETVSVFRYGDNDLYYWSPTRFETTLRQLEHVAWIFSNTPDFKQKLDDSNTYNLTVSTRDKHITLKTPDNDGEFTTYEISLNTKDGTLTIVDGKENMVKLDSQADRLTVKTNVDVYIDTPDTYVTGNVWIDGTLDVKKDTSLHSNLTVDKDTSISGSLSVGSSASVGGSLSVGGSGKFGGSVKAAGHI